VTFTTQPDNASPERGTFVFKSIKIGPGLALDFENTFFRSVAKIGEDLFHSAEEMPISLFKFDISTFNFYPFEL
jgi:hypothetical protein